MSTLAVIPARAGSKGIVRKNLRDFGGRPLVWHAVTCALACPGIDRVIVSTDDPEIADVAQEAGAEVPFLRPAELALDETPGIAPILHALETLGPVQEVVVLQPTSPLRTAADVTGTMALRRRQGAPAAISVCDAPCHPAWMYSRNSNGLLVPVLDGPQVTRRQDLPPVVVPNGAVYVADAAWLLRTGSFVSPETVGFVMPAERSVDLDDEHDWKFAELLLSERIAS